MAESRPRISATIITKNEEDRIEECLRSVSWCDERLVVDSGSTDRTVERARMEGARVIERDWPGYVAQKNFALDEAKGEWIISLDADERCTPGMKDAILAAMESADGLAGFEVRRHVKYLGRWINHGGWYPDWKLRIVRHGKARWGGVDPHDKLIPDGPVRQLDAEMHHFTYRNFAHQIEIINHFSDVVSHGYVKAGRRPSIGQAIFHPPAKFIECYFRSSESSTDFRGS